MTETETRRNHERSYNKYYTMPSREELHRGYSGHLCESDFNIARGKNQFDSNVAKKIVSDWKFDEYCKKKSCEVDNRKVENE
nr:hypothetical protein [uncultured Lachnoclostridium sp.]